jgi:predicted thioesterase
MLVEMVELIHLLEHFLVVVVEQVLLAEMLLLQLVEMVALEFHQHYLDHQHIMLVVGVVVETI